MSSEYAISVRFGNDILEHGFTAIPNLVLERYTVLGITNQELVFIIHVWKYWWNEHNPYPSLNRVAVAMGITKKQVVRYSQSLQEKGFLTVTERHDPKLGQQTNEYDFTKLIRAVMGVPKMSLGESQKCPSPSPKDVPRIIRS
jgi:DNA replication protein